MCCCAWGGRYLPPHQAQSPSGLTAALQWAQTSHLAAQLGESGPEECLQLSWPRRLCPRSAPAQRRSSLGGRQRSGVLFGLPLAFPCACKRFSRLGGQAVGAGFLEGSPPWEEGGGTMAGEMGTL